MTNNDTTRNDTHVMDPSIHTSIHGGDDGQMMDRHHTRSQTTAMTLVNCQLSIVDKETGGSDGGIEETILLPYYYRVSSSSSSSSSSSDLVVGGRKLRRTTTLRST